jgi:hypothetical protein
MLRDLLLLVFCAAVGFVAAGISASFYKLVTTEPARFGFVGKTVFGLATSSLFCALTGPVIVVDFAIRNRRAERRPLPWLFAGMGIAALWSCCTGLVVLQLFLTLRDSLPLS